MKTETIQKLLRDIADGKITPDEAAEHIKTLPYEDLDYAKIDRHREIRTGYPEVVFCLGKTSEQVVGIMVGMMGDANLIMGTKADKEQYQAVKAQIPQARYYEVPKIIAIGGNQSEGRDNDIPKSNKKVAIVSAGTADMPIAEEAAVTAQLYGEEVEKFFDVGVAGIHRLMDNLPRIREANVVIVVAGMEGALASVVGGLVDKPVIAVPTSIGYGTGMGGMTALFSMLNSCSLGVSVMNIDNGFGAGHLASIINRL